MGLINAIGNLGGYAGPKLAGYLVKQEGNFVYAFSALSLLLLLGAALVGFVKARRPASERSAVAR